MKIRDDEFFRIVKYIKENYGVNLTKKRTLIEGRLGNILKERKFEDYHSYLDCVLNDTSGKEVVYLMDALTTNHTYFMREVEHFHFFEKDVLTYFEPRVKDKDLRVWSAGCSTGQEPYTLAMIIDQFFGREISQWDTDLLATDISSKVLKKAMEGVYSKEEVKNLPPIYKMNYLDITEAGEVRIKPKIRKRITFRTFNLMEKEFPFKKRFHVIFCRNVMIYFDAETKMKLIQKFYNALVPGGYLFIGQSESIDRRGCSFKYIMPSVYRKV